MTHLYYEPTNRTLYAMPEHEPIGVIPPCVSERQAEAIAHRYNAHAGRHHPGEVSAVNRRVSTKNIYSGENHDPCAVKRR